MGDDSDSLLSESELLDELDELPLEELLQLQFVPHEHELESLSLDESLDDVLCFFLRGDFGFFLLAASLSSAAAVSTAAGCSVVT